MKSELITHHDIVNFVLSLYGIPDPVMCVWATQEPPTEELTSEGGTVILDSAIIFIKEDVETMFLPRGIQVGNWNLVILCLKYKTEPIIGWIMGSTPQSFLPISAEAFEDLNKD